MTDEQSTPKKLNRSEAKLAYWANIPKEERSKRATELAKAKWAGMTPQERSHHGKMMRAAKDIK